MVKQFLRLFMIVTFIFNNLVGSSGQELLKSSLHCLDLENSVGLIVNHRPFANSCALKKMIVGSVKNDTPHLIAVDAGKSNHLMGIMNPHSSREFNHEVTSPQFSVKLYDQQGQHMQEQDMFIKVSQERSNIIKSSGSNPKTVVQFLVAYRALNFRTQIARYRVERCSYCLASNSNGKNCWLCEDELEESKVRSTIKINFLLSMDVHKAVHFDYEIQQK